MFTDKPQNEPSELDTVITDALKQLGAYPANSKEYTTTVDNLIKLNSMKPQPALMRVSPDTLAIVLGNLLGIMVVVGHERANVVTSKALNFVMKASH